MTWKIRHRCEDNIKLNLKETGWEHMDFIHLVQEKDQWWALLNTVLNLEAHKMEVIS
jgi:hypothetical protein